MVSAEIALQIEGGCEASSNSLFFHSKDGCGVHCARLGQSDRIWPFRFVRLSCSFCRDCLNTRCDSEVLTSRDRGEAWRTLL
jgi:hypothetical protein